MRTHRTSWSRLLSLGGLAVCAASAWAQEGPPPPPAAGPQAVDTLAGGLLQLVVAIIQLVVGLSIAAYAIKKGLDLLAKLLSRGGTETFDIWKEVRGKNAAVAVVGAGVIMSYCKVISSGIESMSRVLGNLFGQSLGQSLVGLASALINLAVAIVVASFAITVVFQVMDKLTPGGDEVAELRANNVATGIVYAGLIFGVSFLVSSGVTSIGIGVNAVLGTLLRILGLG